MEFLVVVDTRGFRTARTPQLWHEINKADWWTAKPEPRHFELPCFVVNHRTPMSPVPDARKEAL